MKHTVEKHEINCGCRSAGECDHNTFAWMRALDALVDEFAEAMKAKLRKKFMEGKRGWDDPEWTEREIQWALLQHAGIGLSSDRLDPGIVRLDPNVLDPIDVANFAAFWWNRR